MLLFDINDQSFKVDWPQAIFQGLSPSGGLYMPEQVSTLPKSFFTELNNSGFHEMAFAVLSHLTEGLLPDDKLRCVIETAFDFDAPAIRLTENISSLELFHGPSMAFKDFGARFMAGIMSELREDKDKHLTILTATSGDTGGAVAQAFHNKPGFKVVVLYPAGKVSPIQEAQFTTLGDNVEAIEIDGVFDDCQALVKQAFLDSELRAQREISSANSINIARLLPQTLYYFWAYAQINSYPTLLHVAVPCGNFGNIVAALIAKRMGLPLGTLIAAVNANRTFPDFLETGDFKPRPSIPTVSNAMDVGNPNNFPRLMHLCQGSLEQVKKDFRSVSYSDKEGFEAMTRLFDSHDYVCDPHGALAYRALAEFLTDSPGQGVFLHTAHPAKFREAVEKVAKDKLSIPRRLAEALKSEKQSIQMRADYQQFKEYLLS